MSYPVSTQRRSNVCRVFAGYFAPSNLIVFCIYNLSFIVFVLVVQTAQLLRVQKEPTRISHRDIRSTIVNHVQPVSTATGWPKSIPQAFARAVGTVPEERGPTNRPEMRSTTEHGLARCIILVGSEFK